MSEEWYKGSSYPKFFTLSRCPSIEDLKISGVWLQIYPGLNVILIAGDTWKTQSICVLEAVKIAIQAAIIEAIIHEIKYVKICCMITNCWLGISWMRQWGMSPTSISICLSTREVHRHCNAPWIIQTQEAMENREVTLWAFLDIERVFNSTPCDITKAGKPHWLGATR